MFVIGVVVTGCTGTVVVVVGAVLLEVSTTVDY